MNATAEILHEDAPGTATAWQPIASLARALGIAERTVRHRVKQGTAERFTAPDGRTYYRAVEPDLAGEVAAGALPAIIRAHLATVADLSRDLATARADAASATATATAIEARADEDRQRLAALDDERRRLAEERQALTAERERLAGELAESRARAERLATVAAAPWYAFRVRRRLRRELSA